MARSNNVIHGFDNSSENGFLTTKFLTILIVVAVLGIGAGYFLTVQGRGGALSSETSSSSSSAAVGTIEGTDDLKTFKDTTQGVLQEGGIKGEGQYHLVRPGGESQNVYLTSSVIDLSKYLKRKIKVWGQTNTAQSAGWLMDVGRVEVIE